MRSELQQGRGVGVSGGAHEPEAAFKAFLRHIGSLTLMEAGTVVA